MIPLPIFSRCRQRANVPSGPPVLSGLVLWLDASQLDFADGASVTSWPDLSDAGTHVGNFGNGVMRTTGLNGKPGVDLSGSANGYTPDVAVFESAVGGTHFSVQNRFDLTTLASAGVEISTGQDSYLFYSGYNYYEASFAAARLPPVTYSEGAAAFSLSPFIYSVDSGPGGTNSQINGVPAATSASPYTTPTFWSIGLNGNYYLLHGLISETLAYSRQLTSDEIAATKAYLSAKWGTP